MNKKKLFLWLSLAVFLYCIAEHVTSGQDMTKSAQIRLRRQVNASTNNNECNSAPRAETERCGFRRINKNACEARGCCFDGTLAVSCFYPKQAGKSRVAKFSEIVEARLPEIVEQIVNHPFYQQAGNGTLDQDKFEAFVQQDDLYVVKYLDTFRVFSERTTEPEMKAFFLEISQDTSSSTLFKHYYDIFQFTPTAFLEPATEAYLTHETSHANERPMYEAVAASYPCWYIWYLMGQQFNQTADLTDNNPYGKFCSTIAATSWEGEWFIKMREILDTYWESLNGDKGKQDAMLAAYDASVKHEFYFVDSIFRAEHQSKYSFMGLRNLLQFLSSSFQLFF